MIPSIYQKVSSQIVAVGGFFRYKVTEAWREIVGLVKP